MFRSIYTYNGLGALMEQTWIIAKNGYGYHDVSSVEEPEIPAPDVPEPGETPDPENPGETPELPEQPDPGINNEGNGNNNGNDGNGHVNGNNGNHTGNVKENEEATAEGESVLEASLVLAASAGGNGNNGNQGNGNGNKDKPTGSDVKKTSTVVKQFVVDFSSETYKPLMPCAAIGKLTYTSLVELVPKAYIYRSMKRLKSSLVSKFIFPMH